MSMAIDGLVSGLDTTSLINSLMQVDAVPQTLLKNKVTATQSMVTALQGLNSKVADLATLAGKTGRPARWTSIRRRASSDDSHCDRAAPAPPPARLTWSSINWRRRGCSFQRRRARHGQTRTSRSPGGWRDRRRHHRRIHVP